MKKTTIGVASFLAGVVMTLSFSVSAAPALKPIAVFLNQSLNINFNGEQQTQIRTPITYDGTTYLPLRDIADMFGAFTRFDSKTQTIDIVIENAAKVDSSLAPTQENSTRNENQTNTQTQTSIQSNDEKVIVDAPAAKTIIGSE